LDFRKVYINLKGNERWSPSGPNFVFVIHKRPSHQYIRRENNSISDDNNIQIEATNAHILNKKVKEVMQQLSNWFYSNKLVINTDKTTVISFHAWRNKSNMKPEIAFQDMDITYKDETKFLGLYLTEDVEWDVHIKHVSNTLSKNYCVIQSLKTVTSINTSRSVYFANFHSHLRYGILFLGGDSQSTKVFKLQKKDVRLIFNVKRKTSCRELFRTLSVIPVPCAYIMEIVYYIKASKIFRADPR
jgi:hypothetical protein